MKYILSFLVVFIALSCNTQKHGYGNDYISAWTQHDHYPSPVGPGYVDSVGESEVLKFKEGDTLLLDNVGTLWDTLVVHLPLTFTDMDTNKYHIPSIVDMRQITTPDTVKALLIIYRFETPQSILMDTSESSFSRVFLAPLAITKGYVVKSNPPQYFWHDMDEMSQYDFFVWTWKEFNW
jgi:hypothetical protein